MLLNGTLWRALQLSLKFEGLETTDWERVLLPIALHSICSLLRTATNATPHEMMLIRHESKWGVFAYLDHDSRSCPCKKKCTSLKIRSRSGRRTTPTKQPKLFLCQMF